MHTPGDWTHDKTGRYVHGPAEGDRLPVIAQVGDARNAPVIALAPELFDLLESALRRQGESARVCLDTDVVARLVRRGNGLPA